MVRRGYRCWRTLLTGVGGAVPASRQHVASLQLLASPVQEPPLLVLPPVHVNAAHWAVPLVATQSVLEASPHFVVSVHQVCPQHCFPEGQSESEAQAVHVAVWLFPYSDLKERWNDIKRVLVYDTVWQVLVRRGFMHRLNRRSINRFIHRCINRFIHRFHQ